MPNKPKPLKDLLKPLRYVHQPWERGVKPSGYTADIAYEMARRLRELDKKHRELLPQQDPRTCRYCPDYVGWPCPDRRVLDGES